VVSELDQITEQVAPDTEVRMGVLEEDQARQESAKNFFMPSEDGAIILEGSIGGRNLSLTAENLTGRAAPWKPLFDRMGQLKEVYGIALFDPDGNRYVLSGGDWLDVAIRLEGAYSIRDLDGLTIRHINTDDAVSEFFFSSESVLDAEGKTTVRFRTAHLDMTAFAVVLESPEAIAPAAIVQEGAASNAASLAQRSVPMEADIRPITLIVLGTVLILAAGGAATDRSMSKRRKSGYS
jgi:hypothetical protein